MVNSTMLVWAALKRRTARTIFTWLSVVVAFILFGILAAVRYGMTGQLTIAAAERLVTSNKGQGPLPISYFSKIASVRGVTAVMYGTGFEGYYKDKKNTFQVDFANGLEVLQVYKEFTLPPAEQQTYLADRQGVIVGPLLAQRMGWKVGDTIPVQGGQPQKNGSTTWYFHLRGIYQTTLPAVYKNLLLGHFQYFNESIPGKLQDWVGNYTERVNDPRNVTQIANTIDALFANSSPQTLTQPQVQEAVSFIRQFGNITAMVMYVGIAVFFVLLLIVGNTLAQSVRERTSEFAMFRTLGFRRGWIVLLVFRESLLLLVSGGIVGLVLGWLITRALYPSVGSLLQTFQITWDAAGSGVVLAIVFGVVAALVPVRWITGLRVADALRRG